MWVIRRRTLIVCSLLLATVIALVSVLSVHLINMAGEDALMTVVIDAGHGGVDGGAVGINTGVKESDLNLKLARELQSQFHAAGFAVVMTRRDENGLYGNLSEGYKRRDMQRRREIILEANPVLVLSIHLNKYSQEYRRGAQVFFEPRKRRGKEPCPLRAGCAQQHRQLPRLHRAEGRLLYAEQSSLSGGHCRVRVPLQSRRGGPVADRGLPQDALRRHLQRGDRISDVPARHGGLTVFFNFYINLI